MPNKLKEVYRTELDKYGEFYRSCEKPCPLSLTIHFDTGGHRTYFFSFLLGLSHEYLWHELTISSWPFAPYSASPLRGKLKGMPSW